MRAKRAVATVATVAALIGVTFGSRHPRPNFPLPPGMGAVVGGIQACYDSGPPSGGYPFVAGTVGAFRRFQLQVIANPVAIGTATADREFVVVLPPGDYELAPYASTLSNPAVHVTVPSGHITNQDLQSEGCI